MNGMEMARCLYEQQGREVLSRAFPELVDRMAIGLAGEGSECFGFDDAISHDHDWGAGFCIWLTQADFHKYGRAVQEVYDSLSPRQLGLPERVNTPQAGKAGRVPVHGELVFPLYRRDGGPVFPAGLEKCAGSLFGDRCERHGIF